MEADNLSERNRQIVQDTYAAAARGDLDAFMANMSDETFVLHEPAFLPYGGSYETKGGMLAAFEKITKYLDVSTLKVEHIIADGSTVFGVLRAVDRASGGLVHIAEQSTLRNGKITEMRIFVHDAQSLVDMR